MLPDANYDCGCRVRSGVDPVDGLDTSRLYPCPLGQRCPNARLFMKTVKAMQRDDPESTVTGYTKAEAMESPEQWKPLVKPVSDEAPPDPNAPPVPIDQTFDCGCRLTAEVVKGIPIMTFHACPLENECANVLQYICFAKSRDVEIDWLKPEETVQ